MPRTSQHIEPPAPKRETIHPSSFNPNAANQHGRYPALCDGEIRDSVYSSDTHRSLPEVYKHHDCADVIRAAQMALLCYLQGFDDAQKTKALDSPCYNPSFVDTMYGLYTKSAVTGWKPLPYNPQANYESGYTRGLASSSCRLLVRHSTTSREKLVECSCEGGYNKTADDGYVFAIP